MQKETFRIQELDCAEECNLLTKALKGRPGIQRLDFDILNRQMHVTYDSSVTDSGKILEMIRSTGMRGALQKGAPEVLTFWQKHGRLILCIASGTFLFIGFILHLLSPNKIIDAGGLDPNFEFPPFIVAFFYVLAMMTGGWFVAPKALASAKRFSPDMNVLMFVAVIGAIAIGQMLEGAAVIFLFSLALLLESWSVDRARRAISALLDLSPTLALVKQNGDLIEKKVEDVAIGEKVLVRPGEKIPLDGEVVAGSSSVNQAPITGESMPVSKKIGDLIFAGT
nr:putative cadmium-transporting ATPase [Chlamydiota bacterium]